MASSGADRPTGKVPDLKSIVGRNWVTFKELAKILDVTYQTVHRWNKQKLLRAIRVGGQWRIYEDELRRFLTEGNNASVPHEQSGRVPEA